MNRLRRILTIILALGFGAALHGQSLPTPSSLDGTDQRQEFAEPFTLAIAVPADLVTQRWMAPASVPIALIRFDCYGGAYALVTNTPSINALSVLEEAGVTNMTSASLLGWTPRLNSVVVTGQAEGRHVLVVAFRESVTDGRWQMAHVWIRFKGRVCCRLFRGVQELNAMPEMEECGNVLRRVFKDPGDYLFRSTVAN